MDLLAVALFFGSLIVLATRKKQYLGWSKSVWGAIGYNMFFSSIGVYGLHSLNTGIYYLSLSDIFPIYLKISEESYPFLFYAFTLGTIVLGATGVLLGFVRTTNRASH